MVFKRRQVVVLSLVIMIMVAGYLQYSYKKSSNSNEASRKAGEAVYVDGIDITSDNMEANDSKKGNESKKDTKASKETNDFFAQAKIEKEITRSKNADQLTKITEDQNADQQTKAKAYDKLMNMLANAEKEMKVENLIRQKGFEDVIALIADDGSIDIIVKTPSLNEAQTAQIADIITRQANVKMEDIKIKPMY